MKITRAWAQCQLALAGLALGLFGGCGPHSKPPEVVETPSGPTGRVSPAEPAEPLEVGKSFWIPGEQMEWELSVRGMLGAKIIVVVGEPGTYEGRRAIIARSRMEGAGMVKMMVDISEEVTSWIDLDSALPIFRHVVEKFNKKVRSSEIRFRTNGFDRTTQRGDRAPHTYKKSLPSGVSVHDTHAMLGLLRAWEPAEGSHAQFYALSSGSLRRHVVRFTGYEFLKTKMGRHPTIRLDGIVTKGTKTTGKGSPYTLWISNDANRMPVRMVVPVQGLTMKFEMITYDRPPR